MSMVIPPIAALGPLSEAPAGTAQDPGQQFNVLLFQTLLSGMHFVADSDGGDGGGDTEMLNDMFTQVLASQLASTLDLGFGRMALERGTAIRGAALP